MTLSDDLAAYTVRPIEAWPGTHTASRTHSPFRAGLSDTHRVLALELRAIAGRDAVLHMAITDRDIRVDGRPRNDAKPWHPGVILTLTARPTGSKERIPLRYACDRFWDLRKVDRYGISSGAEQYSGFKALPPGTGVSSGVAPAMTRAEAEHFLAEVNGLEMIGTPSGANWRVLYRNAAGQLHPDVGGSRASWDRLQAAKEALGL